MKWARILKPAGIALVATVAARAGYYTYQTSAESALTASLCETVGNYLETGAIREAYEGFVRGLERSGRTGVCASVIDQGKSYSTNCLDPSRSYHATFCRAEANQGIRAEVLYPSAPIVDLGWIGIFLLLGAAAFGGLEWLSRFERRVREDEQLRTSQAAKATRMAEVVERMRRVRHDIESPLAGLQMVRGRAALDPGAAQLLNSSINQIMSLTEELDRDGDESPRFAILEVLAAEVVSTLRSRFSATKKVSLSLEYDPEGLSPVTVSPSSMMRVIDNLLQNAFDAVSVAGTIRVFASHDEKNALLEIEDDGCGIDPAISKRLFEQGASFGKVNGTGQGLYSARRLITSWGGRIRSEPLAKGTRFVISLPLTQVGVAFHGLRGLGRLAVVDDDPTVATSLRFQGHDVSAKAHTAREGRELISNLEGGVSVLVDQHLDGDNLGTDLIAGIPRATRRLFLCTSAYDDPKVLKMARAVGVGIVPKPLCFLATGAQDSSVG